MTWNSKARLIGGWVFTICIVLLLLATAHGLVITINTPANNSVQYSSSFWLNWTFADAGDTYPNWCAFELNGAANNTSLCSGYLNDDSEDSYGNSTPTGTASWVSLTNATDENWTTFAYLAGCGMGNNCYGYVYENYTVPEGAHNASWTVRGSYGGEDWGWQHPDSDCWNYTGAKWANMSGLSARVQNTSRFLAPRECINGTIQLRTEIIQHQYLGGSRVYTEGNITWESLPTNLSLTTREGKNTIIIYANNSTGSMVSNETTLYYLENVTIFPNNMNQTLGINTTENNLTINLTTGTASDDPFRYNFTVYGNFTNTSLFNITFTPNPINVTTLSNTTTMRINVTPNNQSNGTYGGGVNVTREQDGKNWTIPVIIYLENFAGQIDTLNGSSTFSDTINDEGSTSWVWTYTCTGNYNCTNCVPSIKQGGGYPNANPYVTPSETSFNVSNGSSKNITFTFTGAPTGYYYQNYLYTECTVSPSGAKDTLDDIAWLAITVTASSGQDPGEGGGGGSYTTSDVTKRNCDFIIDPTAIQLTSYRPSKKIIITNNEEESQSFTVSFDNYGNATPYLSIEEAPPSLSTSQSTDIYVTVSNDAFSKGNLISTLLVGSDACLDKKVTISVIGATEGTTLTGSIRPIEWQVAAATGTIIGLLLATLSLVAGVFGGVIAAGVAFVIVHFGGVI